MKFIRALGVATLLGLVVFASAYTLRDLLVSSTLERVTTRGKLLCGINHEMAGAAELGKWGFSYEIEENDYGLGPDFCKAIAAAIFGMSKGHMEAKRAFPSTRFDLVRSGDVDVLVHNATWTVGRDASEVLEFGPIIFLDAVKIIVKRDSGIKSVAELGSKHVCVLPGTTNILILQGLRDGEGPKFHIVTRVPRRSVPNWPKGKTLREWRSNREIWDTFAAASGTHCDAMAADEGQLRLFSKRAREHEDDYKILPEALSSEPLAVVTRDDDSQWRKIVKYAVLATMYAVELGIDQENVGGLQPELMTFRQKQFLGIASQEFGDKDQIGTALGLKNDFARKIIKDVGNYDDIFKRNLSSYYPVNDRGPNEIWVPGVLSSSGSDRGRLFSPPFQVYASPTKDSGSETEGITTALRQLLEDVDINVIIPAVAGIISALIAFAASTRRDASKTRRDRHHSAT